MNRKCRSVVGGATQLYVRFSKAPWKPGTGRPIAAIPAVGYYGVRAKHRKASMELPVELETLKNDLVWAKYDFNQYKRLFVAGDRRGELLAKVAGNFFERLNRFYWDRFALSVSKLTDPETQGSNKNLTIHSVEKYLHLLPTAIAAALERIIADLPAKVVKFRNYRSKQVAHRDLLQATSKDFEFDLLHISEVQTILDDIGKCLNMFMHTLQNKTWSWDMVGGGGVEELLYFMKEGLAYDELKKQRQDFRQDSIEEQYNLFRDA